MRQDLSTRCHVLLSELGLVHKGEAITATPLEGGVASDIARVQTRNHEYCVKFALPKLKVHADWFAPTHRNLAEYAWLQFAGAQNPDMAVTLYGQSSYHHGFVMEYLQGDDIYLWKKALLEGTSACTEASIVSQALGTIHAASGQKDFDQSKFNNKDDFRDLRIEPYLLYTASQHPDLADKLHNLAEGLFSSDKILIHGDVSPKNIFLRQSSAIILDAECATMGDPVFDLAFCLNHLILKALHLPQHKEVYLQFVEVFWQGYASHICWENREDLGERLMHLLPALMLARIDGKSPVEYLNEATRAQVRALSRHFLQQPSQSLLEMIAKLKK